MTIGVNRGHCKMFSVRDLKNSFCIEYMAKPFSLFCLMGYIIQFAIFNRNNPLSIQWMDKGWQITKFYFLISLM